MISAANHLWQSTAFAAVIILLSFALQGYRAQTRYWLWLTASLKFLLPFSLLVQLGSFVPKTALPLPAARPVAVVVEQAGEPFDFLLLAASPAGQAPVWPILLAAVWAAGFAAVLLSWGRRWNRLRRVVADSKPSRIAAPVPVRQTSMPVEPGVFGIFRPVLLLPEGIEDRLTTEQFEAIIAHELCHVRRRDNLAAAVHMFVEAVFWFHPLVWWIGTRLMEERELACDEEVVRQGKRREAYAEGILGVCKLYLQSPLACASGVTGADLKRRVREIMTGAANLQLSPMRKTLLALTAGAAVTLPLFVGVVKAQAPQTFDVASIRPSNPDERNSRLNFVPGGGLNIVNVPVQHLIEFAYDVRPSQVLNAPSWLANTRYDITARVEKADGPTDFRQMNEAQHVQLQKTMRERMRSLLADRFQLTIHRETRELPILALVIAKGGIKMKPTTEEETRNKNMRVGRGTLRAERVDMEMLTRSASQLLSRTVVDQTGLTGGFNFEMTWSPEVEPNRQNPDAPPLDASGPSFYTALQEQLGLKLESKKGPVEMLVIDRVEKPSEN